MGVSENSGFYPPNHPILIGFSIIFTIHFGVPVFLETPISSLRTGKWAAWQGSACRESPGSGNDSCKL